MAGINKPKYSKKEVSQKFNLKSLLGYAPSEKQKEMFGSLVSDFIVERTLDGKNINNRKFKKYTKEYADKKGVSRDSVNLLLTGDMLESISDDSDNNIVKIKIGDGVDTLKAYNHNVGDTLPKRTFFGIKNEKQISDIISQVDNREEKIKTTTALDILKGITVTESSRKNNNLSNVFNVLYGGE